MPRDPREEIRQKQVAADRRAHGDCPRSRDCARGLGHSGPCESHDQRRERGQQVDLFGGFGRCRLCGQRAELNDELVCAPCSCPGCGSNPAVCGCGVDDGWEIPEPPPPRVPCKYPRPCTCDSCVDEGALGPHAFAAMRSALRGELVLTFEERAQAHELDGEPGSAARMREYDRE